MSTSGKSFTARFGAGPTTITGLVSGEVRIVGDELDETDSDSAPYQSVGAGTTGFRAQLKGNLRLTGTQPSVFKFGTILTDLKIFPFGSTNPEYEAASAICLEGTESFEVRGKVMFTLNIASRGAFTVPGE